MAVDYIQHALYPQDFQTFPTALLQAKRLGLFSSSLLSLMRALDVMHDLPVKDCLCLRVRRQLTQQ